MNLDEILVRIYSIVAGIYVARIYLDIIENNAVSVAVDVIFFVAWILWSWVFFLLKPKNELGEKT